MGDVNLHLAQILYEAARGLLRSRHRRHIKKSAATIEKILQDYFDRQQTYVLGELLPLIPGALASIPPIREASADGHNFAGLLLPSSVAPLQFAVTPAESDEYAAALAEAFAAAAATLGKETASEAVDLAAATRAYLQDNSLTKLTGDFAETTVDRLRTALANAWDAGGSYDQIVSAVQDAYEGFSSMRAGMIAQTEATNAYNAGRTAAALAMGFDEKSWETESGNPCPVCIGNEAEGWIDIDAVFSGGVPSPSQHVSCMCILNYRKGVA